MNTSEEVIKFLDVFNRPLRIKLKDMGINDSDYPFIKTKVIEKVFELKDSRPKQITNYKYNI
tara:strand:+ start:386 stop:571 length:186 start_codon:yes stop_codon:yes gene_type:complete